eukprot:gene3959-7893_t
MNLKTTIEFINLTVIYFLFLFGIGDCHKRSLLDSLEDSIVADLYGSTIVSEWIDVIVGEEKWDAHIIYSAKSVNSTKDTILLVHGYGTTSALAWRGVIPRILDKYNIIGIDLPGFGRTPLPKSLSNAPSEDAILNLYCEFYHSFFEAYGLSKSKPYVVAHSFGGFIITHCASRWPHLVSRMLLSDVPGFFSMNGGWDYSWATFFMLGLPHTALRWLGSWGQSLISTAMYCLEIEIDSIYVKYWHQLQTSPSMRSEIISNHFLRHRGVYTIGTSLALLPLLNLTSAGVPVSVSYGTRDTITPLHQGYMLQELTAIPVFEVQGAGHVPYILNGGADFSRVILAAEHTKPLDPHITKTLTRCLERTESYWRSYPCLPLSFLSDWVLSMLYNYLRSVGDSCLRDAGQTLGTCPSHSHSTDSCVSPQ